MDSITNELKICRKKLHQYPASKKQCPECFKITQAKYHKKNIEKRHASNSAWYKKNIEKNRALRLAWKKANIEKRYASNSAWKKANPDKVNAIVARRKAKKKQALASWRNDQAIEKIYTEATRLSKETGVKHHVDHIYPLQSDWLCGLHVENNLQILTAEENIRKNNKTWPGQYDFQKDSIYVIFESALTDLLND